MLARPLVSVASSVIPQTAGVLLLTQKRLSNIGIVDPTYSVEDISRGILLRSTFATPSADVLPNAGDIFAAFPELTIGDSFELTIVNAGGDTATITASADGSTSINGDSYTALPLNATMWCLFTALSENCQPTSFAVTATNGSAILTPADPNLLSLLGIGMGVTIGATTSTVIGINQQNGTVTMADNFGGTTGSGQVASFIPRIDFLGYTLAPQS